MQYRNLGRSGIKVSEICLGTITFGVSVGEDEAKRIVDTAFDAGISFIDTANTYGRGQSEVILGKALHGRRHDVILATKFTNPTGTGPNDSGMSRVHIIRALDDSLRRLQTDYVDIYYIHHVDTLTPLEEALRALDDLVHQGKVRYIACSNYEAWRLCDALWVSEVNKLARFVCYQPQYSLVVRDIEEELVPLCLNKGVGIVPWGVLASGFLAGKYQPGQRSVPGTRSAEGGPWFVRWFAPNADKTLAELLQVSEAVGHTPAQVALRWALEQPGITSVLTGARNADQLRENVGATGWRLEGDALERLNRVSAPPERYPAAMEKHADERRAQAIKMPSCTTP